MRTSSAVAPAPILRWHESADRGRETKDGKPLQCSVFTAEYGDYQFHVSQEADETWTVVCYQGDHDPLGYDDQLPTADAAKHRAIGIGRYLRIF